MLFSLVLWVLSVVLDWNSVTQEDRKRTSGKGDIERSHSAVCLNWHWLLDLRKSTIRKLMNFRSKDILSLILKPLLLHYI